MTQEINQNQDKLEKLLEMQTQLNNHIFKKRNITGINGKILEMDDFKKEISQGDVDSNSNVNRWLKNFLVAMNDESRELDEELLWKWWSKDSLDLQNIRIEIIDQLHFWISLALVSGMDANQIFDVYYQKNKVNFERQEKGYSKKTKDENDCRSI